MPGKVLNVATRARAKLNAGGKEQAKLPTKRSGEESEDPQPERPTKKGKTHMSTPVTLKGVAEATAKDPWFKNPKNTEALEYKNGVYYMKDNKLVIPNDSTLRRAIIAENHNPPSKGHPGTNRTVEHILRQIWWQGMHKEVPEYVRCCEQCQRNKSKTVKPVACYSPYQYLQASGNRWEWTLLWAYHAARHDLMPLWL